MRWSGLAATVLALQLGACGPNLGDYRVVDVKLVKVFSGDPNSYDSIAEGAKRFPEFLRIEVSSQFDLSKAETGGGLYVEGDRCPIKNSDRLIALDVRASDELPTEDWLRKVPLRANAVDHKFHYFIYVVPSSPARKVFTNSSDTIDAYDLQRVPKPICLRLFAPGYYITKSRSRTIEVSADSIARAFPARSQ